MDPEENPFGDDPDRHAIWDMLVRRDIDAFLAADWSMTEGDFIAAEFFGLHSHKAPDPDYWRLDFPDLASYRNEWLRQAVASANTGYAEPLRAALFRAVDMRQIDVAGDRAVAHKKFDGTIQLADGSDEQLLWQTLYFCARRNGVWKITSFVGYMPLEA